MDEQLPLLDTTCRPTVEPPPGAVPAGPPVICSSCGAFSTPYGIVIDDPLSCSAFFYDPDRRDPLCLGCTIETARRLHAEGKRVHESIRQWAIPPEPVLAFDGWVDLRRGHG